MVYDIGCFHAPLWRLPIALFYDPHWCVCAFECCLLVEHLSSLVASSFHFLCNDFFGWICIIWRIIYIYIYHLFLFIAEKLPKFEKWFKNITMFLYIVQTRSQDIKWFKKSSTIIARLWSNIIKSPCGWSLVRKRTSQNWKEKNNISMWMFFLL